jgi:hypothetical protein
VGDRWRGLRGRRKRRYDMGVSGRHMEGGKRVRYKGGTVSGGQVCGSERWRGSRRCNRKRREIEWGTSVSGRRGW